MSAIISKSKWYILFFLFLLQVFFVASSYADFINGDFENTYTPDSTTYSPINGWTLRGYTFIGNSNTSFAPKSLSDISINSTPTTATSTSGATITGSPGGLTDIISGTTGTLYDYFLFGGSASSPIFTLPLQASQSVIVNLRSIHTPLTKSGSGANYAVPGWVSIGKQATAISQQITVTAADFDPADHVVHVRFKAAPVVNLVSASATVHGPGQRPFFAVQVNNLTTGRTDSNPLAFIWKYDNQPGVPWVALTTKGTNPGANGNTSLNYAFTNWQEFDFAPGNAFIHQGDVIELVILGSGCSFNGHDGHLYVDQVHTYIPPVLWVVATGPNSSSPGQNVTYNYTYTNQGTTAVTNVVVIANLPQDSSYNSENGSNATYVSNTNPTVGTNNPTCTGTGPVTCNIGTLQPGQSGTFQMTVNIPLTWTASGTLNNGNYPISGQGVAPLLGPLIQTTLAPMTSNSNLVVNTNNLPTLATVGTPYSGSYTCTNQLVAGSGFTDAPQASCDVANLPAGLTVTGCTISQNNMTWIQPSTIGIGQTVTCLVAGTPTVSGPIIATVVSDASNNSTTSANHSNVNYNVAPQTFQVTPSGDNHESISPNTVQTVTSGNTQQFTVTANSGYILGAVGGTCPAGTFSGNVYTTGAIIGNCTVSFSAIPQYQVTPSGDNHESISPNTVQTVTSGTTKQFTVTANSGYILGAVGGTCPAGTFNGNVYTTGAIIGNCTVTFSAVALPLYQVTAFGDNHISISPNNTQTVISGNSQQFTVIPNIGYVLNAVGGTCPAGSFNGNTYTTGAINGNCTITFSASLLTIDATLNGSPVINSQTVCCSRPILLNPLSLPGNQVTQFRIMAKTGPVMCKLVQINNKTYLKMFGRVGTCTIVGTKNGISSAPLTILAA